MRKMNCTLEYVNGHIEVYDGTGAFLFSADTKQEALEQLEDAAKFHKKETVSVIQSLSLYYTPNTQSA